MNRTALAKSFSRIYLRKLQGKPFYSNLFVTRRCNSRCGFCNVHQNSHKDLSLDEIKRVVDELADFGIGVIAVTGGEPLLRDDIFEILKHIESKGIVYSIISNGILWDEEKAAEIRKRNIFGLSISLDTLDRKRYKKMRGVDALEKVKETIDMFREKPLKNGFLSTLTTVTDENMGELLDIVKFDRENNCKFTCGPVAVGEGFSFRKGSGNGNGFSKKIASAFRELGERCRTDKTIIGPSKYYKNIADYYEGKYAVPCDAGKYYISVDASAGVSVCQDFGPFGNVLSEGLKNSFGKITPRQRIEECARNSPCFYGCSTFISMLARAPLRHKIGFVAEEMRKGTV